MDDEESEDSGLVRLRSRSPNRIVTSTSLSHPGDSQPFDVFVCSEAGKPVYSFNKDRDEAFVLTLMPLMTAMVSFFSDTQKEDLKSVTSASGLRITFSVRSPLILVVVSHILSTIDPHRCISQVYAQIVSILTLKTLKSVFEQRSTYDLRRLIGGSEKLIDTLIQEGLLKNPLSLRRRIRYEFEKPVTASPHVPLVCGFLTSLPQGSAAGPRTSNGPSNNFSGRSISGRSLIPVLPLNPATRESITNALQSSVSSADSSILFALLFQRKLSQSASEVLAGSEAVVKANERRDYETDFEVNMLITIYNHVPKKAKLNPLDVQLLATLIVASEGQLASAESLWLPVCIPRVDSSAFIHTHISYLVQSESPSPSSDNRSHEQEKMCLLLLTADREDFNKCQHVKDTLSERLNKVHLTSSPFSDLPIPQLQMFAYFSIKPHCILFRNHPVVQQTHFHRLVNYVSSRMTASGFKTFWFQSDDHQVILLGWHSPQFTFYFQFDVTVSPGEALAAASAIVKWIKREEEKFRIKDYL